MTRASFLGSLLGILVCVRIAQAILCFTCEDQASNCQCLKMTPCPPSKQRCVTIGTVSGTGNDTKLLITKKCMEKCPSEQNPEKALNSLFCCEHSLCNFGPPK